MDGPEWQTTRKKMNPVFLKKKFYQDHAFKFSNKVTDALVEDWRKALESAPRGGKNDNWFPIKYLEKRLHRWSVESVLASLFGERVFATGNKELYFML